MSDRNFRKREIFSEDGTLKFYFKTSLKKIALAKVASLLCISTQHEMVNWFHSSITSKEVEFFEKWQQNHEDNVAKISELCLPGLLPKMLKEKILNIECHISFWKQYHVRYILDTGDNSNYAAVDLVSHIVCTGTGRIDFAKTAKNILYHNNSLSDDQKYKIACIYCLEDEIAILASKVLNPYYLDSIDIDIFPMVYFWTTHITGDSTKLYNHYNDYLQRTDDNVSINEFIMKLLIRSYKQRININTVPITYMWNKFSEEEKTKNLISLVELDNELDNEGLRYPLLSNLNYEQQQDIFKKCSGTILCGILNNDLLFEQYFLPVALSFLEFIDKKSYRLTLNDIANKMKKHYKGKNDLYSQYKDFFKILWECSPRHLKDYIFDKDIIESFVCYSFSWKQDLDLIDLIFKDLNAQQKKKIIFGEDSIEKCSEFIQNDEWTLLELFMRRTLSSEEDVIEFKKTLTRQRGEEIVRTNLLYEAYDKIKPFMDWAFKSKEEESRFRQSLVDDARFILSSDITNGDINFTKLENYFKWCANDDLELINKFKSEMLGPVIIRQLIKEGLYDDWSDKILNWCFLGNQQQIAQFKCNIAGYELNVYEDSQMILDDEDDDDMPE